MFREVLRSIFGPVAGGRTVLLPDTMEDCCHSVGEFHQELREAFLTAYREYIAMRGHGPDSFRPLHRFDRR